jgi:hypothetical protein
VLGAFLDFAQLIETEKFMLNSCPPEKPRPPCHYSTYSYTKAFFVNSLVLLNFYDEKSDCFGYNSM